MSVKLQSALVPPAMTTAQRDAIPAGRRPSGAVVYNTTTNRVEVNYGTDAAPYWGSTGPVGYAAKTMVGSGAVLTLNAALPGLSIVIPAQPTPVHARVMSKFRVDHVGAAGWTYSGSLIVCSPAAVAGGTSGYWDTLLYTYGAGGPLYISHTPLNWFDLAANQAYTISVFFNGQNNVFNWDAEQSWLEAEWFPR